MWLLGANWGLTLPQQSTFVPVPLSPSLQGLLDLPSAVLRLCWSPNHPSGLCFCAIDVFIKCFYALSKLPLKIHLWSTLFWRGPSLESVAAFFLSPSPSAACPSLRDICLLAIVVFSLLHNHTSILPLEQVSNRSYIYLPEPFTWDVPAVHPVWIHPFSCSFCFSQMLHFCLLFPFWLVCTRWVFSVAASLRNLCLHDRQHVVFYSYLWNLYSSSD